MFTAQDINNLECDVLFCYVISTFVDSLESAMLSTLLHMDSEKTDEVRRQLSARMRTVGDLIEHIEKLKENLRGKSG